MGARSQSKPVKMVLQGTVTVTNRASTSVPGRKLVEARQEHALELCTTTTAAKPPTTATSIAHMRVIHVPLHGDHVWVGRGPPLLLLLMPPLLWPTPWP